MNYELARHHMIEQQLRTSEVLSSAVVDLLYADRREDFVPATRRALAFADIAIPLGGTAAMLTPKLEARVLQAAAVQPNECVLEIGTGSGHMAALLAANAREVWSVEIDPALAEQARANLARLGIGNVHVETGDGLAGLPEQGPFDVIVVSGGMTSIPDALVTQLAVGGRLLAFVGANPVIVLRRLTRRGPDAVAAEDLMETSVPMLQQAPAAAFHF
jgi:protein-L-isoaspartate(D-aspartate) O-methyltransferase